MKKYVLYCDDKEKWIKRFKENHESYYHIRGITDIRELLDALKEKKPDIVLLDLFHPRDRGADFEKRASDGEIEMKNLDIQIEKTKKAVYDAWTPWGIHLLEEIRKKYSARQLPVVIYTEHGMSLLSDEELRKVEELDGHFMKKNYLSDITEKLRLERIMAYAGKNKSTLKYYRIALIITYALIAAVLTILFLPIQDQIFETLVSITTGVISGVIVYFITKRIEK